MWMTIRTMSGGGGVKSLGLLGGATGRGPHAHFREIPKSFFPGGGGGCGEGQATRRETKRATK